VLYLGEVFNSSASQISHFSIFIAHAPAAVTILCFPVLTPSASPPDPPVAVQAGQKPSSSIQAASCQERWQELKGTEVLPKSASMVPVTGDAELGLDAAAPEQANGSPKPGSPQALLCTVDIYSQSLVP